MLRTFVSSICVIGVAHVIGGSFDMYRALLIYVGHFGNVEAF